MSSATPAELLRPPLVIEHLPESDLPIFGVGEGGGIGGPPREVDPRCLDDSKKLCLVVHLEIRSPTKNGEIRDEEEEDREEGPGRG
jgi:hypothetical protein